MRSILLAVIIMALLPVAFVNPFTGVLLWSWISFMSPMRLVWGFADGLPFALIVGVVTIVAWIVSRDNKRIPWDGSTVLIMAFVVSFTISTVFALAPDEAWPKWWLTTKGFIFLFVTAALLTNRVRIHALVWVIVISVGFYGIKGGAFALVTGGNFLIVGPASTMIGDNNHIACALVVILPLITYLGRQSKLALLRFGSVAVALLCLMAALSSYSRGAVLALAVMVLFLWWNSKKKVLTAMAFAVIMASAVNFMPPQWFDRIHSIETYEEDASATGRLDIWRASFKIALARPFVGGGFKAPYQQSIVNTYAPGVKARAVHSIYFEVIGENGFLAFGLWLAIVIIALHNCWFITARTRNRVDMRWANDLARMCQVSLIGYLVGGAFLSLSYWDIYFALVVIVAAVRRIVVAELAVGQEAGAQKVRAFNLGSLQPGLTLKQIK